MAGKVEGKGGLVEEAEGAIGGEPVGVMVGVEMGRRLRTATKLERENDFPSFSTTVVIGLAVPSLE